MRSDNSQADNLFSRLFSYTPREGEKKTREPLEDFCTEALAYLLISSVEFRQCFLERILDQPLDSTIVQGIRVDTQKSYTGDDDE